MIERLDLRKRTIELEWNDPVGARSLSSFAFARGIAMLKARFFGAEVEMIEVDPVYTSLIRAVDHVPHHGTSST